jgi:predicted RNA-binding Zn-ribbon protein involved in translation (DUF1610 family)
MNQYEDHSMKKQTMSHKGNTQPKGPWLNRAIIWVLTLVFGVLVYLLEGFFLRDIESIDGPDRAAIQANYVDAALLQKSKDLSAQIADLNRQIARQKDEQKILSDGSRNLQQTIGQLIEMQKLSLQKEVALTDSDQENLTNALNGFLATQTEFQTFNETLHEKAEQKRLAEDEKQQLEIQLEGQRIPAEKDYYMKLKLHGLWLATLQLIILIPLLAAAAFFVLRKSQNVYFPVFLSFGIATLIKSYWVMNKYFPAQYVKYILIIVMLFGVGKILVYAIRLVSFPGKRWLQKQYREAYERFLCPICEYPIRTGPRRFLFWTRRTAHKTVVHQVQHEDEQAYTCPSCGTGLFEECSACHDVRHSLLTHCSSCGVGKEMDAGT